jgi:large subunit ribosomal protein L25
VKRVQLSAVKREVDTKGKLNKVRSEGYVPAIVYGEGLGSVPVQVKEKDLAIIIEKFGRGVLIDLDVEGTMHPAIFKEVQKSKIGRHLLHVDFEAVNLDKPVYTKVKIVAVGESKGVKAGGILDQELRDLEVEGIMTDLPDKIEVEITNLDIKDVIYVHDLKLSDKIKVYTRLDAVILSIVTPTVEEVAPAAVPAEAEAAALLEAAKEGAKAPEVGKTAAKEGAKAPEVGKTAAKEPEAKPVKEEKK